MCTGPWTKLFVCGCAYLVRYEALIFLVFVVVVPNHVELFD